MTDTTIDGAESSTPATVLDFFANLVTGTWVHLNGTEYAYAGTGFNDEGTEQEITLWTHTGGKTRVAVTEGENRWEVITSDDGSTKIADSNWLTIARECDYYRQQYRSARDRNEQLAQQHSGAIDELRQEHASEINVLQADWTQLNAFLNEYADDQSMCGQYEEKLESWNHSFEELKLRGREKDWVVVVDIVATYSHRMTVRATSYEEAKTLAEQKDSQEVYREARRYDTEPDVSVDISECYLR